MSFFTEDLVSYLRSVVFRPGYPGYRPNVVESPNGDGVLDREKRYAHVAHKYLTADVPDLDRHILRGILRACNRRARQAARMIGVPDAYLPLEMYSALRVLEYPPGATSAPHTDFDLLTLSMYRDRPELFRYLDDYHVLDLPPDVIAEFPGVHVGEIMPIIMGGRPRASAHEVVADPNETTVSVVYFAIPDHNARLPTVTGQTVGGWIADRISRSRHER